MSASMMNLPFRAAPYFGTVAKCGHGGYRTKAEGAEREREREKAGRKGDKSFSDIFSDNLG